MSLNPRIRDWRGRRVWVVGASSGIGAALAQALLAAGARVALSARRADRLAMVAGKAPNARVLPLDVTSNTQWQSALADLMAVWGGIDQLVICAADYHPVRAWTLDATDLRRSIDINLSGAMTGIAMVLPDMLARGQGAISLVASVAGLTGLPQALVYGPTKAGLINFAEALYLDVKPRGLAVHLINPGFVDTPLTRQNDFPMPALLTPGQAASAILAGMSAGKFDIHFPKRFTFWLRLLRCLPYGLRFRILAKVAPPA